MKSSARPSGWSPPPARPAAPPMSVTPNLPARWWPTCAACGLTPFRVVGEGGGGGGGGGGAIVVVVVVTGGGVVVAGASDDDGAVVVVGCGSWLTGVDEAPR